MTDTPEYIADWVSCDHIPGYGYYDISVSDVCGAWTHQSVCQACDIIAAVKGILSQLDNPKISKVYEMHEDCVHIAIGDEDDILHTYCEVFVNYDGGKEDAPSHDLDFGVLHPAPQDPVGISGEGIGHRILARLHSAITNL